MKAGRWKSPGRPFGHLPTRSGGLSGNGSSAATAGNASFRGRRASAAPRISRSGESAFGFCPRQARGPGKKLGQLRTAALIAAYRLAFPIHYLFKDIAARCACKLEYGHNDVTPGWNRRNFMRFGRTSNPPSWPWRSSTRGSAAGSTEFHVHGQLICHISGRYIGPPALRLPSSLILTRHLQGPPRIYHRPCSVAPPGIQGASSGGCRVRLGDMPRGFLPHPRQFRG